jgi:hypothetical protein
VGRCTLPLEVFAFGTPPDIDHAMKNYVLELRAADGTSEFPIEGLAGKHLLSEELRAWNLGPCLIECECLGNILSNQIP